MTSRRIPISVFFPCYNEEENVESLVQKTLKVLPRISDDYEVIVVNDGSIDKTAAIVESLANDNPKVRLVNHPINQGYGGALQSGFRAATKEWVFYTDGDGQFDITELPGLLDLIDQADIITCYRIERAEAGIRKLNSWAWSRLVNRLFKLNIRDVDCAFKLYKREIFENIEMYSRGALIDTEILSRAKKAGYTMIQKGVHHYPRRAGTQSGANLRVIFRAFKELFRLRKQIQSGK